MKSGKLPRALRALSYRNFRLFFAGQSISLIGTWMQTVAQSWLVYRLTGSAVLLGTVGFAGQIPVFLIAPFGGVVADRHARLPIIVATQTTMMMLAFVLAFLTLSGYVHVWHIIVLAIFLGLANAFDIPARQAFVVEMVGRQDLMNAIALNSSLFNGARVVGPAIAGITVAAIGEGWCFFANGISYIAVIVGLLLIRVPPRSVEKPVSSPLHEILEGWRFAAHNAPIRAILLLLALVSFVGMPYAVLMPVFAEDILHSGARGLGILMGATGIGALIGALLIAARREVHGLGRWVAFGAAGFGVTLILFATSRTFWLSAAFLIPVGGTMMVQMSSSNTLIQTMVPDRLRGRIMALYSMMFMGMAPLGSLLAGWLADTIGAPATIMVGGALCIVGSVPFALSLRHLRGHARQLILAQQMVAGDPADEADAAGVAISSS